MKMKKKFFLFALCFGVIILVIFLLLNKNERVILYKERNIEKKESYFEIKKWVHILINPLLVSCFSGQIVKRLIYKNIFLEKYLLDKKIIDCIREKLKPSLLKIKKWDWYIHNGYLYFYKGSYFTGRDVIKINK